MVNRKVAISIRSSRQLIKNFIEIINLHHIYKAEVETIAISNLFMNINKGEKVLIRGKSGTGKTTLLHCISGILKPSAGKIIVDGDNIVDYDLGQITNYRRYKIGLVYQSYNLVDFLTVCENIELPMKFIKKSRQERKKRVKELSISLGINRYLTTFPPRLSGGEQQRVAIAVAMANNPPILLADEPSGNLDEKTSEFVYDLLNDTCENYGTTLVIASHDPLAAKCANRIIEISKVQNIQI